jgi:hypothetical protein
VWVDQEYWHGESRDYALGFWIKQGDNVRKMLSYSIDVFMDSANQNLP